MSRKNEDARGRIRAQQAIALIALLISTGCATEDPPPIDEPLEGPHVFISGGGDGLVHVFDEATLEEVAQIDVGAGAGEVHATPDGRLVWTLAAGAAQVTLIDAATLEARVVPVGARPVHSYLEPDGARIWVGNDGSGDVSIIELATGHETRVLTGNGHHKAAFVTDAEGALAFVYVSNISDGTLSVIDPEGALVENVSVGPSPHGITFSPHTRRVYNCSGDEENSIEVLDPWADDPHSVVARIPLPGRCGWIHADHHGGHAWAGLASAGLLARVDLEAGTAETWEAGPGPDKCAIVGERAFVANVTEPTVTVIDLESGARRTIAIGHAHIENGRGHRGIRHHRGRVYVPNAHDGTVSVIDAESEAVIATLEGIEGASGIALAGGGEGTPPE